MADQIFLSSGFIDITPVKKYSLAGFKYRKGNFEGISDNLELNAIILKDNNEVGIIMSADLLFITDEIKAKVLSKLRLKYSIKEENFFFSTTHTHFAPATDFSKPLQGKANPEYVEFIIKKASKLIEVLLSRNSTPVKVYYGSGMAQHAVNRRRYGWMLHRGELPKRGMAFLPNFAGTKDETIRSIVFKDLNGSIRAVIWNYACHPSCFPKRNEVSAEFPGVARNTLRNRVNDKNLPVLFAQGFSGNVRPPALDRESKTVISKIKKLLNGVSFREQFTSEEYNTWTTSLSDCLTNVAIEKAKEKVFPHLNFSQIKFPLGEIIDGNNSNKIFSLQKFQIAPNLIIVGISAEVVVEYTDHLRGIFPNSYVIPVGCLNSVFGYLPTQKMAQEGGYESGRFFELFGIEGKFIDSVERVVLENLKRLACQD